MAEKNSLWKNIRNKAKQNKESGATPKKPTTEMLRQERKIKAKQYAEGSFVGEDELPTYRYANKEGVIGGPRVTDKGTWLPTTPEGTLVVNMPEFEVISTGPNTKPNPYSPVTGEEYLSSSYNPVNLFLPPQVEKQRQPIDPKTGMPLPQSGLATPVYPETELIGVKKGKEAIDAFKHVDYGDLKLPINAQVKNTGDYEKGLKKIMPEKEYLTGKYKQHAGKELKKAALAFSPSTTKALGKLDDSIAKRMLYDYRFGDYSSVKDFRKAVKQATLESERLKKIHPTLDFGKLDGSEHWALKDPKTLKQYADIQLMADKSNDSQKSFMGYLGKDYNKKMDLINQNEVFKNIANESPQYTDIIHEHLKNPKVSDDEFVTNLVKQSNTFNRAVSKPTTVEEFLTLKGKSLSEGKKNTIDVEGFPVSGDYGSFRYKMEPNAERMAEIAAAPIEQRWAQRFPENFTGKNENVDFKEGWLNQQSEAYKNWWLKRLERNRTVNNVPMIKYPKELNVPIDYINYPQHRIFTSELGDQPLKGFDVSKINIENPHKYIPGFTRGFAEGGYYPTQGPPKALFKGYAEGGKYLTVDGQAHKVYRNADGDIIVNHPKEDLGKWDTINLTDKSNANTIAEGVASVKKWHRENPSYAQGGYTNPYNQYQDDPYLNYAVGGKVWKNIAAGAYGLGEGILDTVTMGATDELTDKGFEALTKVGNKNIDLNNPDDVKFLKTQQKVKGYTNTAGAIGTAAVTGNVQGAIKQGTKGLNTAFQATDGLSDDFKKWSQGITGIAGVASGFAGGLNSDSFTAAAKAGTGAAGFGQKVGKFSPLIGQASGMLGGNNQPLWQQGDTRQDYLNSPEYLALKNKGDVIVNQGVNFSQGGNITNNSLNLRNTMRYKRFAKGGTFDQFGINFIPDSAGLHHESAYGGVPIGPDALAEGGEIKMDIGNGSQYIVSDQVDGAESQKDFTFSKGGKYKELNRTLADGMKQELNKYTFGSLATSDRVKGNLRRPNDSYAQNTIDQIKQKWQEKTEYARKRTQQEQAIAQAEEQKRLAEEEFIGAYGGKINPKKYDGLNMPGSYAKGGIHINPKNKGKFTASAKAAGHTVQEHARAVLNDPNATPLQKKRANFAKNAAGWKHADGGYVHNQMIQPMVAEGGPIYGDPASDYVYAMGGVYGDPYYRGGQIDYTNDMYSSYASGGPMVGNAPQAFKGPAAQNRGGMLMTYADGGMMPQEQQMMQEQQMQQQGGQEQMMQMVQQVEQMLMQGVQPEQVMQQLVQSGIPQEQAQQVIQMAMQDMQSQQQQQPMQGQEQMMPQQGMMSTGGKLPKEILRARAEAHMSPKEAANYVNNYSRGGKMRYDGGGTFGPITEAEAIANGYQPTFQDEIDYTQIPDSDELYPSSNLRANPNIGGILAKAFKISPEVNYPPELPDNQLTDLSQKFPQKYMPFFDVNANPGDETTMPDGTTFDGNVYNTQTPTEHYYSNQDVLTGFGNKYPGDSTNTSNVNKNTDTPWSEEPLYSKISRYGQAIPGVVASITAMRNKKRRLDPELMGAQTVSYEPERIIDREESRRALDSGLRQMRNSASNAGMLMGNTRDAILNANKGLAGRIAESVMREANTNAQLAQQTGMTNVANKNQFKQLNEQMFQNAQTQAIAGFGDTTSKLASAAGEERKQYLQEWIAKNRLGTRSYKTNINGQDVFVNADGQIYDAKTGTLLSAG